MFNAKRCIVTTITGFATGFICLALMAPDNPVFDKSTMFIMTVILGIIYGILIEFVTSVLFKAKMELAPKLS